MLTKTQLKFTIVLHLLAYLEIIIEMFFCFCAYLSFTLFLSFHEKCPLIQIELSDLYRVFPNIWNQPQFLFHLVKRWKAPQVLLPVGLLRPWLLLLVQVRHR